MKFICDSDKFLEFSEHCPGLGSGTSCTLSQLESEVFWPLKSPLSKAFRMSESRNEQTAEPAIELSGVVKVA